MDGCNEGDVRELTYRCEPSPAAPMSQCGWMAGIRGRFSATRERGRGAHEQIPAQGQI